MVDATVRPLAIPPEMATYAEKHAIFDIFKALLEKLLIHKPSDPLPFLVDCLKRESTDEPRIVLLGPPASGKMSLAQLVSKRLLLPVVVPEELVAKDPDLKDRDPATLQPLEWATLLQRRLSRVDCDRKGWILVGFPRSDEQALALQTLSVFPKHVVLLNLPDDVALERAPGKRIDRRTGEIYHTTFDWPTEPEVVDELVEPPNYSEMEIRHRLAEYQRHVIHLMARYNNYCKTINADQPKMDVAAQVMRFLSTKQRTGCPLTARVLLLGPPGCGKSYQALRLCAKYDLVNVCCGQLIKEQIAEESKLGMAIKIYVERNMLIPDALVLQILSQRLSRLDCTVKGWVLHGYPLNTEQASQLEFAGFAPNRVIMMNIGLESIVERISLRRLDPVTGRRFHLLFDPPPSQQIKERLVQHPKDSDGQCQKAFQQWLLHEDELIEFYRSRSGSSGGVRHIDADQDPHSVFECIESIVAEPSPDQRVFQLD